MKPNRRDGVDLPTEPKIVIEYRGDDEGKPFVLAFMMDTPESLATRTYDKMLEHWDDKDVRAAFEFALRKRGRGAPGRRQSDRHMLDAYKLWAEIPGNSPGDKRGFAKYWKNEKKHGHSVDANVKRLDRALKRADTNR